MTLKKTEELINHLTEVINWRMMNPGADFEDAPPFTTYDFRKCPLGEYILVNELKHEEVIVLLMALLPRLEPLLLKNLVGQHGDLQLLALCQPGSNGQLLYPTGETIQYIVGGRKLEGRNKIADCFEESHFFSKNQVLYLGPPTQEHVPLSGKVGVYEEAYRLLVLGKIELPKMSKDFPAQQLRTKREWDDLILPKETLDEIRSIQNWYESNEILMKQWKMENSIKPGYRVLFYGDSGTGKTLAASLLGRYIGRPVFRVDVSMLVSKYIGETEKHLSNLFNRAEDKNWILFFDEADAIFGKRTSVRDAHDKYANQEVSYLLQRIETFSGLVILASNFKNNMDKAFMRRFHTSIKFNNPKYAERLRIWQHNLPSQLNMESIDIKKIANHYELTGANIMNIIQDISLKAISSGDPTFTVNAETLSRCIKKEYDKEDKV